MRKTSFQYGGLSVLELGFIVNILHAHSRKITYPFSYCPLQVKVLLIYHLPSAPANLTAEGEILKSLTRSIKLRS